MQKKANAGCCCCCRWVCMRSFVCVIVSISISISISILLLLFRSFDVCNYKFNSNTTTTTIMATAFNTHVRSHMKLMKWLIFMEIHRNALTESKNMMLGWRYDSFLPHMVDHHQSHLDIGKCTARTTDTHTHKWVHMQSVRAEKSYKRNEKTATATAAVNSK